jgi:predicted metalloprotease with PDZ domain
MKKILISTLAMGAVLSTQAVLAEKKHPHEKCSQEAEVCLHYMAENIKKKGWIGVEWDQSGTRPVITKVVPKSPAEKAGIQVGDAIVAFNGISTTEEEEVIYAEVKKVMVPGNKITLTMERSGKSHEIEVELGRVPDQLVAQWVGHHMLEHHAEAPEEETEAPKP